MINSPRRIEELRRAIRITRGGNFLSLSEIGLLTLVVISQTILLSHFQGTGDLHDAGVYFRSGLDVLNGDNPYPKSRWGTFGPVPFALVISLIPGYLQAITIKLFSILSLMLVMRYLLPRMSNLQLILGLFFCTWLSAFRELIVTNQMSLISLGLFTIGAKISKANTQGGSAWGSKTLAAFFFLVALELKPHLILAVFIFWVIRYRLVMVTYLTIFLAVVTHAAINFSQGEVLEVDFLNNLLGLGDKASSSALGDSLSFWPILNHYIQAPSVYFVCALILPGSLALFGAILVQKKYWLNALFIAFLIPSTSIYFHFYDSIPICVIAVYSLIKLKNVPLGTFTLAFLFIPKEFLSHRNQLLVIFLTLFFSIYATNIRERRKILIGFLHWISGLLGVWIVHMVNTSLNLSPYLYQSLIVTETIVLSSLVFLYATVVKKVFESQETMIP